MLFDHATRSERQRQQSYRAFEADGVAVRFLRNSVVMQKEAYAAGNSNYKFAPGKLLHF